MLGVDPRLVLLGRGQRLLGDVHAYVLCSVAMHLRLSQVVNEPMYTVSAAIAKSVLPPRMLF